MLGFGVKRGHVCHALVDVFGIERIPDGTFILNSVCFVWVLSMAMYVMHWLICLALNESLILPSVNSSAQEILLHTCIRKFMVLPVIISFASVVGTVSAEF